MTIVFRLLTIDLNIRFPRRVSKIEVSVFGVAHEVAASADAGVVADFDALEDDCADAEEVLVADGGFAGDAGEWHEDVEVTNLNIMGEG